MIAIGVAVWPSSAGAAVSVGHSGWSWISPSPQGNTLRSLDSAGGSAFAVGDFGTALRTDDGGATWTGLATGVTEDLTAVEALDADTVVAAGGCAVIRSDDRGASFGDLRWRSPGAPCSSAIAGISFPTSDVGYLLLADGEVYRTDDGGERWERVAQLDVPAPELADGAAGDLLFVSADTGIATTPDAIFRTTDGGSSWNRVHDAPAAGFGDLLLTGSQTIYAACRCGAVGKSTDGGRSWSVQPFGLPDNVPASAIACADETTCVVPDPARVRVLRTLDGGSTWTARPLPALVGHAVTYAAPLRVIVAGGGGVMAASGDAGASWTSMSGTLAGRFLRLVSEPRSGALLLGEQGTLLRSHDDGLTWEPLEPPSSESLVDASFPRAGSGFVLDAAGAVFRTDDGGATWERFETGVESPHAIVASENERVLLVGPRGVRLSTDGGERFTRVGRRAVRRSGLFGVDRAGESLFAYGPLSLFTSRDGGRTWRTIRRPDHRPLAAVDFVGSRVGFALGKGGRLWRTRDRGKSWKELLAAGTDGVTALAFSDARHGYLAAADRFFARGSGRPDYLLRTSDGGRTWRPQIVSASRAINSLVAADEPRALLLAGDRFLFRTASGGDRGAHSRLRLRASRSVLGRPGRVRLTGTASESAEGESVTVAMRTRDPAARLGGSLDWAFKEAPVGAGGRFTSTWRIRRTSVFVAQWPGGSEQAGSGSRAVKVVVRRR